MRADIISRLDPLLAIEGSAQLVLYLPLASIARRLFPFHSAIVKSLAYPQSIKAEP